MASLEQLVSAEIDRQDAEDALEEECKQLRIRAFLRDLEAELGPEVWPAVYAAMTGAEPPIANGPALHFRYRGRGYVIFRDGGDWRYSEPHGGGLGERVAPGELARSLLRYLAQRERARMGARAAD